MRPEAETVAPRDEARGSVPALLLVGWAMLGVAAIALRAPAIAHLPSTDEVFTIVPAAFWDLGTLLADATSVETSVNPPLWRLGWTLVPDHVLRLRLGQFLSLLLGALSVPLVARLAWRASSGSALASLVAGAFLLVHPEAILVSGLFRVYASVGFVALLHLDALGRLVEGDAKAGRTATVTAMLLLWLHYGTLVPLGGCALLLLAHQGLLATTRTYAPAVLSLVPLLPMILMDRQQLPGDMGFPNHDAVSAFVIGGSTEPLLATRHVLSSLLGIQTRWVTPLIPPTLLMLGCAWIVLGPAGTRGAARAAATWTAGASLGIAASSTVHLVREPATTFVAIGLAVCLGMLAAARPSWLGAPAALGLFALLAADHPDRSAFYADRYVWQDAPKEIYQRAPTWGVIPDDRVWVAPAVSTPVLAFAGPGSAAMAHDQQESPGRFAFRYAGLKWIGWGGEPPAPGGIVLWCSPFTPPDALRACTRMDGGAAWSAWTCPSPP